MNLHYLLKQPSKHYCLVSIRTASKSCASQLSRQEHKGNFRRVLRIAIKSLIHKVYTSYIKYESEISDYFVGCQILSWSILSFAPVYGIHYQSTAAVVPGETDMQPLGEKEDP